jgi:integrase/recombinase XerD
MFFYILNFFSIIYKLVICNSKIAMKRNLTEYFTDYINEVQYSARLRPRTILGYKAVFFLFLKVMPEVSGVEYLTSEMLTEFFKRIDTRQRVVGKTIKSGVKKSTIRTFWYKLNGFFMWLDQRGYIAENPLRTIKPPQVEYIDFRRLKDQEIHKIYSAIVCHSTNSFVLRRDTVMVSLLLYCGIRKGEFLSLQVRDVDLYKDEIIIRGETSKSKKTRILKIHPTLSLHLRDYFKERNLDKLKTEHLLVSVKEDSGLTEFGLKHWVKTLSEKAGVKFYLHQFRHTFACKLAEANVNIFKIQKMMGHTDIAMTMKYVRSLSTEDMEHDINKISV